MADFDMNRGKIMAAYALIAGILYLSAGIMEIFGIISRDIIGGIMLMIIAATYLAGIKDTSNGNYKGLSFLIGGLFLSTVYGILYILMMIANWLEYLTGNVESFSLIKEMRIEIWLFFTILPLVYLVWKNVREIKW